MINHCGVWKLFFVWDTSLINEGKIIGYIYDGNKIESKNITSLSLSRRNNDFIWVNLNESQFHPDLLHELKYPIRNEEGFFYGNHSPSMIQLPVPDLDSSLMLKDVKVKTVGNALKSNNPHNDEQLIWEQYKGTQLNASHYDSETAKHFRKSRNRRCSKLLNPVFRTTTTVGLPYITIFQPENYVLPYKNMLQSSEFLVAVPYVNSTKDIENHPFCKVDYALIQHDDIKNLHELDEDEYNKTLDFIKFFKFSLFQPTYSQPTRFCIVSVREFEDMKSNPKLYSWDKTQTMDNKDKTHCCELKYFKCDCDRTEFLYGLTNLPNVVLPGVCVSMWKHSSLILDVPIDLTKNVERSIGRGFGDRSCAPCLGVNAYFGHHYNKRVIDRPETKPGTRVMDHYGRQNDKYQELIPICQKFIYNQAKIVRDVATTMNNNYMTFIGYRTCDRIIWTQGMNEASRQNVTQGHQHQKSISFSNKLHIDKCDIVKKETTDTWFEWMENLKNKNCTTEKKKNAANHVISKFSELEETFGIGLPTTCGYAYVTAEESDIVKINSSFIQMNFAMPITNKVIHHMYAWTFPHATALTIAHTSDCKILVKSGTTSKQFVNVVAWGNSGGSKHAERRNINH